MLMQSLQQSVPSGNEDSIPTYRVTGLGYYTSPGGSSATGFYVDEVSISSEKRNFVWENVSIHDYYDNVFQPHNLFSHLLGSITPSGLTNYVDCKCYNPSASL